MSGLIDTLPMDASSALGRNRRVFVAFPLARFMYLLPLILR